MVLAMLLLPLRLAWAGDDGIERQLQSDYLGKVLTLRHFYSGDHLRFHADGTLQGDAEAGPWTLDAQIAVTEVQLRSGLVIIKGRRIYRVFDPQLKPQDELMVIDYRRGKQSEDAEKILRSLSAEVEIELPDEEPDQEDISSAIHNVFLTDSESMIDVVPSYWRAYFAKQEGKRESTPESKEPVYRSGPGDRVSAPHPTYRPAPEYSEEARELKHQGTVLISLVVDASGSPIDLQIQRPAGLGLDEKAVAAVSTWKFEPAQKDGKPVAVEISTEVQFHLY